jgi:hypothetical protein
VDGNLAVLIKVVFACLWIAAHPVANAQAIPMTGPAIPELATYDRLIPALLSKYNIPGARRSRLPGMVGCRSPAGMDMPIGRHKSLSSQTRCLASRVYSKPITTVAVLKLVEGEKLNLDGRVWDILSGLEPPAGKEADPRWRDITVRHLLSHSGGWERALPGGIERWRRISGSPVRPYGTFCLECSDAPAGWIVSLSDLLRWTNSIDGRTASRRILSPETIQLLAKRPAYVSTEARFDYGRGWNTSEDRPDGGARWLIATGIAPVV